MDFYCKEEKRRQPRIWGPNEPLSVILYYMSTYEAMRSLGMVRHT